MLKKDEIILRLVQFVSKTYLNFSDLNAFRVAAVLIIIHFNHKIPHILLTKRSSTLKIHASEISFPGGTYNEADKSLCDTAIRETREEIGINFTYEDLIGNLSTVYTLTSDYAIVPFITIQQEISNPQILSREVEKIIDVPLFEILETIKEDTEHWQRYVGGAYKFGYQNEVIWGATARILKQLYDFLVTK
jgi:8-oxo-dGTP pyrophosphatase MutT (NUDIX family)